MRFRHKRSYFKHPTHQPHPGQTDATRKRKLHPSDNQHKQGLAHSRQRRRWRSLREPISEHRHATAEERSATESRRAPPQTTRNGEIPNCARDAGADTRRGFQRGLHRAEEIAADAAPGQKTLQDRNSPTRHLLHRLSKSRTRCIKKTSISDVFAIELVFFTKAFWTTPPLSSNERKNMDVFVCTERKY